MLGGPQPPTGGPHLNRESTVPPTSDFPLSPLHVRPLRILSSSKRMRSVDTCYSLYNANLLENGLKRAYINPPINTKKRWEEKTPIFSS